MRKQKKESALTRHQRERKRILRNLLKRKAIRGSVEAVGGVGLPSKMPGTSFGIPAPRCKVGGKLRAQQGSICEDCYAMKNNYTYPSVIEAQEKRFALLGNWEEWITAWTDIFTYLGTMLPDEELFHRWHDAGDVQGAEHLGAIVEVARRNPGWGFWLPSKEYGIVRQYVALWDIPGNLTIRMSSTRRGEDASAAIKDITGLWSTVDYNEEARCPARDNEGFCGACRDCWDVSVPVKDYPHH